MEGFPSNQSSVTSHTVVNYSSSSYGGFLFRSPNSPPPSPPPSSSRSSASLSKLFLDVRPGCHGSGSSAYYSSPAGCFQLRQPPLLPFPRSATLPTPGKRISADIPRSFARFRRQNSKRKGKMFAGAIKETPPVAVEVKVFEKGESNSGPAEEGERRSVKGKVAEEEHEMESVYPQSPPPSSLPFPRFSLMRPKDNGGGRGSSVVGSSITELAEIAGDKYRCRRI